MKEKLASAGVIGGLVLIIIILCVWINNADKKEVETTTATTAATAVATTNAMATTAETSTMATTAVQTTLAAVQDITTTQDTTQGTFKPQSTKEIIDKYTLLVDKFKTQKPAFKKKEYQTLPEEYRNFDKTINFVLNLASNYMVTQEECEELVRSAGAEEILYDMPIHGTEKGCALTNYDAVSWAKCDDNGDGTYRLSFSLKEEVNAEPTPADTLIAQSAHGAVMQPMPFSDLKKEVYSIASSVPGVSVNDFSLTYRDCEFSCVYNHETDEVLSITHHIVIDISADIKVFSADIKGSAILLNEMKIYDIAW